MIPKKRLIPLIGILILAVMLMGVLTIKCSPTSPTPACTEQSYECRGENLEFEYKCLDGTWQQYKICNSPTEICNPATGHCEYQTQCCQLLRSDGSNYLCANNIDTQADCENFFNQYPTSPEPTSFEFYSDKSCTDSTTNCLLDGIFCRVQQVYLWAPGQFRCSSGDKSYKCDLVEGWIFQKDCVSTGQVCDTATGRCVAPCSPGSFKCDGGVLSYKCAADGIHWEFLEDCFLNDQICNSHTGQCEEPCVDYCTTDAKCIDECEGDPEAKCLNCFTGCGECVCGSYVCPGECEVRCSGLADCPPGQYCALRGSCNSGCKPITCTDDCVLHADCSDISHCALSDYDGCWDCRTGPPPVTSP